MKVGIIFFSPWQATRKITEVISNELKSLGHHVVLFDISDFLKEPENSDILRKLLETDLIIFGSPVYARLFPKPFMEFLEFLPGKKLSGKAGFLIASYGGITSGIALLESGKILTQKGMKIIGGMKVKTPHSLYLKDRIGNWESADLERLVKKMLEKLLVESKKVSGASEISFLDYQSIEEKHLAGTKVLPPVEISREFCTGCGLCVKKCPVNRLELMKDRVQENHTLSCLACGECNFICSKNCFAYPNLEAVQGFLKRQLETGKEMSGEPEGSIAFFPE